MSNLRKVLIQLKDHKQFAMFSNCKVWDNIGCFSWTYCFMFGYRGRSNENGADYVLS